LAEYAAIGLETRGDINLEQCVGAFAPVSPILTASGGAAAEGEEGRQQRDRPPGLHELLPGRSGEEDRQQGREAFAAAAARKRSSLEPVLSYLRAAEASPALVAAVESLYHFIARSETSGVTAADLLVRSELSHPPHPPTHHPPRRHHQPTSVVVPASQLRCPLVVGCWWAAGGGAQEHRRQEGMRAADQEEALRHLLNFENVVEVAAYEQR
jgi:hypothetical protein